MKQHLSVPLTALLGGAVAFVLRLLQNRTGFEAATGLAIPGNIPALALVLFLALVTVSLLAMTLRLRGKGIRRPAFPANFSTDDPKQLTLSVAGSLLIALSGVADIFEGLTGGNLLAQLRSAADPYGLSAAAESMFAPRAQLILGLLSLLAGAALLVSVISCKRKDSADSFNPVMTLVAPVVLVVRLVLTYRADSVNPSLAAYYVSLLALVFLTLALYRFAAFAFEVGTSRRFTFYSGMAVLLNLAALADGGPHLSALLLCAGGAMFLLGFLLRTPQATVSE